MTYPDTAPFNSRVSPATDDMAADEWFMSVARDCCAASDVPYASEASGDPNWKPHAWVIAAIRRAYQAGQVDADAKAMLLHEAMSDQHETLQSGMVKSAIAATLEAFADGEMHAMTVDGKRRMSATMNLGAQPTIFDRWDYDVVLHANPSYAVVSITSK